MPILLNYTKSDYLKKIDELEGYYKQLQLHLENMQALKAKMFNFWKDENARKAGLLLATEIRSVQNAMDSTSDSLIFYRSAVADLDQAGGLSSELLEMALGILGGG